MVGRVAATLIVVTFGMLAGSAEPPLLLGALEEVQGHYAGQPNARIVRAAFRKVGSEWKLFETKCEDLACFDRARLEPPLQVTWTVGFDGRKLGEVTTRTPARIEGYSDVGRQEITSKTPIPTIGKRSREYGGWAEDRVYRPLVANSQPFFKDPDIWKRVRLSPELRSRLLPEVYLKYPVLVGCIEDDAWNNPRPVRATDIRIAKTYSSRKHWTLVEVRVKGCTPDDELGWSLIHQWFVIDPKLGVRFLAEDIWLVDAGDYDNDGKSELLFAIDGYNRGGYVLFYGDFKKRAVFEYSYH